MSSSTTLSLPLGEMSAASPVHTCHNLTLAPDGRLHAAPALRQVTTQQLTPLACCGPVTLLADRTTHDLSLLFHPGGALFPVGTLASEPLCALAVESGFIIMTTRGPATLTVPFHIADPSDMADATTLTLPGASAALPRVTLSAVEAPQVTCQVEAMTLTGLDFSRSDTDLTSLPAVKPLRTAMLEAYRTLATRCAAAGTCLQPVMAACRYIAPSGAVIHTSAPVPLFIPGQPWQLTSPLTLSGTRSGSSLELKSFTLAARPFTISFASSATPDRWAAAGVAAVEVLLSPMLHPVDFSAPMPASIVNPATPTPALRVVMPGATASFSSLHASRMESLIALVPRFSASARVIVSLSVPLPALSSLPVSASADPEAAVASLRRTLATPLPSTSTGADSSLAALCAPPASFAARRVAVSGDAVVWADITPIASTAIDTSGWFAQTDDAPCSLTICASRRGLPDLTFSASLTSTPLTLAPVIALSIPLATQITFYVTDASGQVTAATLPLTPDASGSAALYVAPTLEPVALRPYSGEIPAADTDADASARRPGAVLTASLAAPLVPLGALLALPSPVVALHPAPRSPSALSASQRRFNIFSAAGTHLLALSSRLIPSAATLIDARSVDTPEAVAPAPGATFTITRCGSLLAVTPTSVRRISDAAPYRALAYAPAISRLLAMTPSGDIDALYPSLSAGDAPRYRLLTPCNVESIFTSGSTTLLFAPQFGLYTLATADADIPVRYALTIATPPRSRPRALILAMAAARFSGSLTLTAHAGAPSRRSFTLGRMLCDGPVNTPLFMPLIAPVAPWLTLEIQGTASPDIIISDITLRSA